MQEIEQGQQNRGQNNLCWTLQQNLKFREGKLALLHVIQFSEREILRPRQYFMLIIAWTYLQKCKPAAQASERRSGSSRNCYLRRFETIQTTHTALLSAARTQRKTLKESRDLWRGSEERKKLVRPPLWQSAFEVMPAVKWRQLLSAMQRRGYVVVYRHSGGSHKWLQHE